MAKRKSWPHACGGCGHNLVPVDDGVAGGGLMIEEPLLDLWRELARLEIPMINGCRETSKGQEREAHVKVVFATGGSADLFACALGVDRPRDRKMGSLEDRACQRYVPDGWLWIGIPCGWGLNVAVYFPPSDLAEILDRLKAIDSIEAHLEELRKR